MQVQLSLVISLVLSVFSVLAGCGSSGASDDDVSEGPQVADGTAVEGLRDAAPSPPLDAGPTAMDATVAVDSGGTEADAGFPEDSCAVEAPTACPTPMPTYATVEPIFAARCVVCHAGNWNGPWPLDSYRHVADWKDDIRSNLLACTMPPPEARIPMTREERLTILTWIRCNIPR